MDEIMNKDELQGGARYVDGKVVKAVGTPSTVATGRSTAWSIRSPAAFSTARAAPNR
jgi:hypothetical protein